MPFRIVIEPGPGGYGAYVPDLPGCVAAARTQAEVKKLIAEAIPFHLEGMRRHGEVIPALPALTQLMGRDVRKRRRALGLTQPQLAALAHVRLETIRRLERGEHAPSTRTIDKIDKALSCGTRSH
jgi:predicted RNase H-like HicB family nuclease